MLPRTLFQSKINLLHDAVSSGSLNELQNLLQEDCSKKKKMVLCKDTSGVGLLHKAIYYDLPDIAKYLMENFPQTVTMKDAVSVFSHHIAFFYFSKTKYTYIIYLNLFVPFRASKLKKYTFFFLPHFLNIFYCQLMFNKITSF